VKNLKQLSPQSSTRGHENLLERLDEVPGIDKKSAQSVLGEVGVTLDEFKSMVAFVAWAGLCPGNNESAGKMEKWPERGSKSSIQNDFSPDRLGRDQD